MTIHLDPIFVVLGLVVGAFLLPPKWDPVFWLMKFNEQWKEKLDGRKHDNRG